MVARVLIANELVPVESFRSPTLDDGMRRSKFCEQHIAFILRQTEKDTRVEEVCRKASKWRNVPQPSVEASQ